MTRNASLLLVATVGYVVALPSELVPLSAFRNASAQPVRLSRDLDVDVGIGDEVVIPVRVARRGTK